MPGERTQGLITRDWRQFVAEGEITSYVGDVLAAVAAETPAGRAREAAALVEVEYEVLEPVTDPFAALEPGAPAAARARQRALDLDHAARRRRRRAGLVGPRGHRDVRDPVHRARVPRARVGAGRTRRRRLHVYSQGQGVWDDRRQVASFLGLPETQVRVTQVSNGGAFGAKEDLNVQGHAALLAHSTRRPVAARRCPARRASRSTPSATRSPWSTRSGCDADGTARGRAGPDGRRHRGVRERRRQGPRARGRARLQRVRRAERRRRGPGRLHEQPAGRGDARVRGEPGELRDRGHAGHPRRAGRHRRLGHPVAERRRGRRDVRDRPGASARASGSARPCWR